jgi:hypothetical protein
LRRRVFETNVVVLLMLLLLLLLLLLLMMLLIVVAFLAGRAARAVRERAAPRRIRRLRAVGAHAHRPGARVGKRCAPPAQDLAALLLRLLLSLPRPCHRRLLVWFLLK